MFSPYPYQAECLKKIDDARNEGKRSALAVLASGLGKTVAVALDVKRWLQTHGGRVLYLCHQNHILDQARVTFEAVLGREYTYAYFHGEQKDRNRHSATCLFSSFQTMREQRNGFQPKEFSYVVVDESHHGPAPTYRPTLEYFQPDFLLGITATPERTDLQDIHQIYGEEVFSLSLEDALVQGLLTPVDYRLMTDDIQNLDALDTPVGRMSIGYLNKKLFIPRRDEEIAHIITKHMSEIPNPKVMVFCPSVTHCDRLAAFLVNSLPLHYKLSSREQGLRLKAFRNGLVNIVFTVDKFNEGIDIPDANMIVFLRSTSSRMLFLQQLGRGLRRTPGKKRVLVLDFVGNCERLEMVHKVWETVGEKRGSYTKKRKKLIPFNVDFGRVKFTEVARRVLEVITALRTGYTKELCLKQLRDLAEELGRTPKKKDLKEANRRGKCASERVLRKFFGSFNAAIEAAGLMIGHKGIPARFYPRESLPQQLQALSNELGRVPRTRDIEEANRAGKCASVKTFRRVFGSLSKAFRFADLSPRKRGFGRDDLITQLKSLARELGRTPGIKDVEEGSKAGKCAGPSAFYRVFGSFLSALEVADLSLLERQERHRRSLTSSELILQLKRLAEGLGRTPKVRDIQEGSKMKKCASPSTFSKVFGSVRAAVKVSGVSLQKERREQREKFRKEIASQLKSIAKTLGRRPRLKDLKHFHKVKHYASPKKLYRFFKSFGAALKLAGLY